MARRRELAAYAAIFVAALALRVWGIDFGLPALYHPDEPAYVLQALGVGRGLPNGLTFADPPLFKYMLLGEYAATYGLERVTRATTSAEDFISQFRADPSRLYLLARLTSALFGALTTVATGVLGATVGGRRAGLLAAGLSAVAFLLVRESHFGVNDSLLALLVTVGLVCCARIVKCGGALRDYVMAGALTGLAFDAKYDGLILLVPLVVAHALRSNRRDWRKPGAAVAALLLVALLAFPSLVLEPARVVSDMYLHLYVAARNGYDGLDPSGGYAFYARTLAIALGLPLLVLAVAGMALAVARRDKPYLIVAALPLALLLALGSQQLYFARFALPAVPALLVLATNAVSLGESRWLAVAVALAAIPTVVDSVRFDGLLTQTDTRTLASGWIAQQLPAGATLAVDAPPLGPPLATDAVHNITAANDGALFDRSLTDYRQDGVEYVVVSSFVNDARAVDAEREARRVAFNAELTSENVVAAFRPYRGDVAPAFEYDQIYAPYTSLDLLERPGPTITVYRLTR